MPEISEQMRRRAAGLLYDPNDDRINEEFYRAKDLCHEYNLLKPSDVASREKILDELLGSHGKNIYITQPFYCDCGSNIRVGDNFYSNHNLTVLDIGSVIIGDNVLLGPNVCITCAGHPLDVERRNAALEYAYPVVIGSNVWVGAGVSILPGVTIGNNCVIGAMSVVNRDIPDNSLAVGNPCRVIRQITDEDRKRYLTAPPCCAAAQKLLEKI